MDDLSLALGEHGVNVNKPDYCELILGVCLLSALLTIRSIMSRRVPAWPSPLYTYHHQAVTSRHYYHVSSARKRSAESGLIRTPKGPVTSRCSISSDIHQSRSPGRNLPQPTDGITDTYSLSRSSCHEGSSIVNGHRGRNVVNLKPGYPNPLPFSSDTPSVCSIPWFRGR